jgi:hypothetical protein
MFRANANETVSRITTDTRDGPRHNIWEFCDEVFRKWRFSVGGSALKFASVLLILRQVRSGRPTTSGPQLLQEGTGGYYNRILAGGLWA